MRARALLAVAAWSCMQAAPGATSLDELLEQTGGVRAGNAQLAESRAAAFRGAAVAEQDRMLKEAMAARAARATEAKTLADAYSANEIRINELNGQLKQKATDLGLGELFGLARQGAADVASVLQQSLVTAQWPAEAVRDRENFLRRFAETRTVATTADLERLWLEIQREMTASGEVHRFDAPVVQPGGRSAEAPVVRIGPFTAVAEGRYLGYVPALQSLHVLPRQPPAMFTRAARDLQAATSGYVAAMVDPARGVLLALYVERPTIAERIELGGEVGYVILAVGAAGAAAFLVQLLYLIYARLAVAWQLRHLDRPRRGNALGRVLLAFTGAPGRIEEDAEIAELRISEAVLREVPKLERFQALLRLTVAAGPLLGLIGTVIGMIMTFQSITESGSSDPKLMATGIGQAMIATVLGLGIAIPLLFANAGLATLSRTLVQILDEQSAGLLAESLEKRRGA